MPTSHFHKEKDPFVFVDFRTPLSNAKGVVDDVREALEYSVDFGRTEAYTRRVKNPVTTSENL